MKQKHLLNSFLILGLFLINVSFVNAQNSPDTDEYSIYTTLLQEEFLAKDTLSNETKEIVIENKTVFFDPFQDLPRELLKYLSTTSKETLEDFRLKNKEPVELTNKFNLKVKITFVGKEIDEIFAKGDSLNPEENGWEIFRKKYPAADGFNTFSRVGFNKDKTQALVLAANHCGWLCGAGWYYLLEKKDSKWTIKDKEMAWVS